MYENNKELFSQIYSFIRQGDLNSLKEVLSLHPEFIDVPIYGGPSLNNKNLLHFAATHGNKEICLFLLEKGFDINSVDDYYVTPLEVASSKGNLDLVKEFIFLGAKVNGDSRCALTPLISAVSKNHNEIVEYLIEHGADVNRLQANFNLTALDFATRNAKSDIEVFKTDDKTVKLLESKGATKAYKEFDLSVERAGGVLSFIHHEAGWLLFTKLSKGSIDIRTALLRSDKEYKVLFTIGMHEKLPRIELMLCVRHSWVVNEQLANENNVESFPTRLLFELAAYRLANGEITEGFIVEKVDDRWNHLAWPEKIDAFIAVDYEFFKDSDEESEDFEPDEEIVNLLLLVPIKYPKTGRPKGKKLGDWIEKRRVAKWSKNALTYDHLGDAFV